MIRPAVSSGSIPACAGEPDCRARSVSRDRVHPRVCGGAVREHRAARPADGPSPRVRGSRRRAPHAHLHPGSIPACAGEPRGPRRRERRARVHPRVCGGAAAAQLPLELERGPSPRVRGSPTAGHHQLPRCGSIPACAGEPSLVGPRLAGPGVHPRVCGGARAPRCLPTRTSGPSPRVRGSLLRAVHQIVPGGSIPACAGEPCPGE